MSPPAGSACVSSVSVLYIRCTLACVIFMLINLSRMHLFSDPAKVKLKSSFSAWVRLPSVKSWKQTLNGHGFPSFNVYSSIIH